MQLYAISASQASRTDQLRRSLLSQTSRLALRSAIGVVAIAGSTLLVSTEAWASCTVGAVVVQCNDTSTTNTTFPTNSPLDRAYQFTSGSQIQLTIDAGRTVSGYGLATTNNGSGGIAVTNGGTISVDVGNTPTAGGTAALTINAAGGPITYTGGGITNNGVGNAFDVAQTGAGSTGITVGGNILAATGNGITVRDVATSTGMQVITNGTVTALTAGKNAIDVQSQSLTGNVTAVANGNVQAGNAGIVAALLAGAATGNIDVTANGSLGARFGIDAENFGTGTTRVTTVGPVTATSGNGIFALTTGGAVTVTAGNVTSSGNTAIFAQQVSAAGTGAVNVTAGTVSGTTGIFAVNSGSGAIGVTANGNVTGSSGDGIFAQSAGGPLAITVAATGTVSSTGATAIESKGAAATVTVAGAVNGGAGGAIKFDQAGVFANRLELVTGAVINGNVLGGPGTDTLGLSGSGSGSFNVAQLSSFEAGQKTGGGTWTLTGADTGITAFSVGGGTLFVNGSLSNAAFTVNGGTLGGTGTVGNTQINAGGIFAPGSGTTGTSMTVNGTLGLNAAATYAVHLNSATSSFANVSGTATLGSATVNAIFANTSISQRYTILTAGTRSGTFGTLTNTNLPANFNDTLSYDATHAYLNLTLAFQPPGGLNRNQQAVADVLTKFFNSTSSIPAVFGSLNANGLSQVSGESATGSQQTTFNAMGLFMGLLTDPFIDGRGDGPGTRGGTSTTGYASTQKPAAIRDAYAMFTKAPSAVSFEQRWSVWAAGYGGSQTTAVMRRWGPTTPPAAFTAPPQASTTGCRQTRWRASLSPAAAPISA
jgi:hypothetical protein